MDQELIAYLDQRFSSIDQRFRETSQQIEGLRQETSQQIEGLRQETSQQIEGLQHEIGSFRQETTSRFEQVEETIRHTQVIVEALHGKIGLVAKGVTGANERLDSFRGEFAHETGETRKLIHLLYSGLDRRVLLLQGRRRRRKGQNPAEPL